MRLLTENTARLSGGRYISAQLRELLLPDAVEPANTKTAEEIAAEVMHRAGLTLLRRGEEAENGSV